MESFLDPNSTTDSFPIEKHIENFGYGIMTNVLSEEKCLMLADELDRIEADRRSKNNLYCPNGQAIIFNLHIESPEFFLPLIDLPQILSLIEKVLGPDFILDSCAGSRSILAENTKFGTHIDGHLPISNYSQTTDIQFILCLDPFTRTNGATKIWPMSHKTGICIQKSDLLNNLPDPVCLTAPRGSAGIFLGQTWHQIGKNNDNTRRWGLILHYKRWWIKPSYDFTQCGEKIFNQLNNIQKKLLGFNSRSPSTTGSRPNTLSNISDIPTNYNEVLKF